MKDEEMSVYASPLVGEKNKNFSRFLPRPLLGEVISYFILHPSAFG
jgi:hypothetical protein